MPLVAITTVFSWQPALWAALTIVVAVCALAHLLLRHRDYRSAAFWVALIVVSPLIGSFLYVLLGINFVRRRGRLYRGSIGPAYKDPPPTSPFCADRDCASPGDSSLAVTLDRISRFAFCTGNDVRVLVNGDEAMPEMLKAIREARTSVALASYIFEAKGVGAEFVTALAEAVRRGVEVRVMVDDAGTRYSWAPHHQGAETTGSAKPALHA